MIIGVTGTNGSGKGTVVEYLVQKYGLGHYSVRTFLTETLLAQGSAPEDRGSLRDIANDLRKEHGPAYVIEQLFAQAKAAGVPAIIESVRTIGEAEYLQSVGAKILAVDADRELRYQRIIDRGSVTDRLTFEEFCIQEDREMSSTEPWDMNVAAVMRMADFVVTNDGSLDELYSQVGALPLFS
jgi:dephospho-CoA kinase